MLLHLLEHMQMHTTGNRGFSADPGPEAMSSSVFQSRMRKKKIVQRSFAHKFWYRKLLVRTVYTVNLNISKHQLQSKEKHCHRNIEIIATLKNPTSPKEGIPRPEAEFADPPVLLLLGTAVAVAMKLAQACCVAKGTVVVPAVEDDP